MILDLKYIIWLWSKYVKRRHIPYMELEFHYLCYNNRFATLACRIFTLVGTGGPAPWRWPFPDR